MAVCIRLRRMGNKNNPHYRIVATDSRKPRDGRFLEILGHYTPQTDPPTIKVKFDAVDKWVEKGAQVSDTVKSLIKRAKKETEPGSASVSEEEMSE